MGKDESGTLQGFTVAAACDSYLQSFAAQRIVRCIVMHHKFMYVTFAFKHVPHSVQILYSYMTYSRSLYATVEARR